MCVSAVFSSRSNASEAMQPNPKIVDLLQQGKDRSDTAIVSLYNVIKQLAIADKIIYQRRVPTGSIGVYRDNRDGTMVSGQEALKVLDDVCSVGIDLDLIKDATAFEEPASRVNEKAFLRKCENDHRLPSEMVEGCIEISSVSCTHFTQAMNMIIEGKPHNNKKLCVEGFLSKPRIAKSHPLLEPILEQGMTFWIWKAAADTTYPGLADLAQRALNAKFSVQQGQDCFQMFCRAVTRLNSATGSDKVQMTCKDIIKANPKCANEVVHIVEMARKYGGKGSYADQLADFCSAFKVPGRSVASSTWKALAEMKFPSAELCPLFMISVLMALAAAPTSNFITSADVKKLVSAKKEDMKECEGIIKLALRLCDDNQVPTSIAIAHLGKMRTNIVFKLFEKGVNQIENSTYTNIAGDFFELLKAETTINVANPWQTSPSAIAPKESEPKRSASMDASDEKIDYDDDGQALNIHAMLMRKKGFAPNVIVKYKETGERSVK